MKNLVFSCVLLSLLVLSLTTRRSDAQSCPNYELPNNKNFQACNALPVLNSFLYYTYDQSTHKIDIAYRHTGVSINNWVSWAINPTSTGMVGSQALVAYTNSTGSVVAYTSPISAYRTSLAAGNLSFGVSNISAVYDAGTKNMIIFANLQLTSGMTSVNQVWQVGPLNGDTPSIHATSGDNVNSKATLNLLSGVSSGSGGGGSRQRKRNIHGVLNAVSWGILLPMGAIMARYLKVFKSADPAWFYLHVTCQLSAFIVGVAGFGTGLKLGNDSAGVTHHTHRNIGIAIFSMAIVQVCALFIRPNKDHKYRLYWNIYHHSVGYAVIVLSVVNVYQGLDILDPAKKWKRIYTGIIIALGAIAVTLELLTWIIVIKRKKGNSGKLQSNANGYNARSTLPA